MEKEIVLQEKYNENTVVVTPKKLQIIDMLSNGFSNSEIAEEMSLSVRTIEAYRYDLLEQTGYKNLTHLIASFLRKGLIK